MSQAYRLLPLGIMKWLPLATLVLVVVLMGVVSFNSGFPIPPIMLGWGCVYYWVLFQPARMPVVALVGVGIIQDVVYGFPLGSSALCFVLLRLAGGELRRIMSAPRFIVTWCGFGFACMVMAIVMAISFSYVQWGAFFDLLLQWAYSAGLSWLCYPPLHWLCNRMYMLTPSLQLRHPSL